MWLDSFGCHTHFKKIVQILMGHPVYGILWGLKVRISWGKTSQDATSIEQRKYGQYQIRVLNMICSKVMTQNANMTHSDNYVIFLKTHPPFQKNIFTLEICTFKKWNLFLKLIWCVERNSFYLVWKKAINKRLYFWFMIRIDQILIIFLCFQEIHISVIFLIT